MKTYKDIYKFPLINYHHRVYDSKGNFVFQFEPKWTPKGKYEEGYLELEEKLLNAINNKGNLQNKELNFTHKEGKIYSENVDKPIIIIRGWGNLTGIGGHNLKAEEAANIQDTFAEYLIERLNKRD